MKHFFFSLIILLFSFEGFSQMEPTCLRLEGIQLPCLRGGVEAKPVPGCNGTVVPDENACSEVVCRKLNIIQGDYSKQKAEGCKEYNYQCSGSYSGDGCTISCNLSGNSCIAQRSGNCGGIGFSCGAPQRGSCKQYNYTCESFTDVACWDGTYEEVEGEGVFDPDTNCCKCPRLQTATRCGATCQ